MIHTVTCRPFARAVYAHRRPAGARHVYTFGVVKEAQARGDFDALAKHGRRALRVDVGDDATMGLTALRSAIERVLP